MIRLFRDRAGATAIEYALMAALIGLAGLSVFGNFGAANNLSALADTVAGVTETADAAGD